MRDAVYIRTLQRALEIKGGADALATYLGTPVASIHIWQKGLAALPAGMFLKIVDIVIQDSTERLNNEFQNGADHKRGNR